MKISIKYTGSIINLPSAVVDTLKDAGENELKVLIGITSFSSYFNDFDTALPTLCDKLELSASEVINALSFWAKEGIIELEDAEVSARVISSTTDISNSSPSYTGTQITNFLISNPNFKMLADCAQDVLGKLFTANDYNSLHYLKEYFGFSDEYILMFLAYCQENGTTSWYYIRKTAKALYDEGIDTYEKLENHFAARRNKRSFEYKVRKLFDVGMREFTKKERNYFDNWVELKTSYDLIKLAYEISIDNGKGVNWSYINRILENWHTSGVKTVKDAEDAIIKNKRKLDASSFDADEFFEAALKRSNEELERRSKK